MGILTSIQSANVISCILHCALKYELFGFTANTYHFYYLHYLQLFYKQKLTLVAVYAGRV